MSQSDHNNPDLPDQAPNIAEGAPGGMSETPSGASPGAALMHGHLRKEARGFWADAWSQVVRRPGAIFGLTWVGIVAFFAAFAPLIANGHPLILWELNDAGEAVAWSSPLVEHLSPVDVLLIIGGLVIPLIVFPPWPTPRSVRLLMCILISLQAGAIALVAEFIGDQVRAPDVSDAVRSLEQTAWFRYAVCGGVTLLISALFALTPVTRKKGTTIAAVAITGVIAFAAVSTWWSPVLHTFEYRQQEAAEEIDAVYTLIPLSPFQRSFEVRWLPPGSTAEDSDRLSETQKAARRESGTTYLLGTDGQGQDVFAQLIHACRLSISIGLVSTGIAVTIGVTLGALMGYFGGWVDLMLYRIVEIFMAIPVLFLLIVASAVLQPNIYVMMAIIGCATWTGAARFTRAEFYRLRDQEFVQAARALGLPLRSILFRHMLPNGVTPVLVDASFAIAAAILIEAILSFLLLGPTDQASWGRLLADAINDVGGFLWWLAVLPGFAIFLTVLGLTLVGEALRDAIDPKLKKAAH